MGCSQTILQPWLCSELVRPLVRPKSGMSELSWVWQSHINTTIPAVAFDAMTFELPATQLIVRSSLSARTQESYPVASQEPKEDKRHYAGK